MHFFTLADGIQELKHHVNGGSCNTDLVIDSINRATRRLLNRPQKPVHIRRYVRFWTNKDMITLPHEVNRILHYTIDGCPAPLFSQAYEFVSHGPGDTLCNNNVGGKVLHDLGDFYSTCFDIPCEEDACSCGCEEGPQYSELQLVAFSDKEADRGVMLNLQGRGPLNHALMADGVQGVELPISVWDGEIEGSFTHGDEHISLSTPIRDLQYVQKPVTEGFISLYTYDPTTHKMYFLSKYHPHETAPRYRRYRVTDSNCCGTCILAFCEFGYVPATHNSDILLIQNLDALKMMIMAMEMEDERDFEMAKVHEADAYRMIDDQRSADRTHDYNFLQVSPTWGFGDISKA